MASGFLFLTRLLALLAVVTGSPYGNVGCHFSPVCSTDESCEVDNLFGSCVSQASSTLPYFNPDSRGLRQLKGGVKFLIGRGYQWKDEFTQDFLRKLLAPYRLEYPIYPNYDQIPQDDTDPQLLWEPRDAVPRSKKYAANDYPPSPTEYDIVEEYLALLEELRKSQENSLQHRFEDYYARYLQLLQRYEEFVDEGAATGELDEYGESLDEMGNKMALIKSYLQRLYEDKFGGDGSFVDGAWVDNNKPWEEMDASVNQESVDVAGTLEEELAAWLEEADISSSSAVEEYPLESSTSSDIEDESFLTLAEQLIPFLNKADREEWDRLSDEEKLQMLEEVVAAVGSEDEEAVVAPGDLRDDWSKDRPQTLPQFFPDDWFPGDDWDRETGTKGRTKGGEEGKDQDNSDEDFEEKELFLNGQVGAVEKKAQDPEPVEVNLPVANSAEEPPASAATPTTTPAKTFKPKTTPPATGYAYIALKDKVSQEEAEALINDLSFLLGVPSRTFSEVRSHGSQVTFFVNANEEKLSPAMAATGAVNNRERLENLMDVKIAETGVGKEVEIGEALKDDDNSALVGLTVILSLCIVLILVVVISIYCFRRRSNLQAKLKGLSGKEETEPEAKSDYQDLCRQRMATKNTEKPEPLSRISSIAQSEGAQPSPSSRSSTSSWSEEPVQSNMDISTGHVVLSYMEDHLKNQDRLSKEWEALCTYEADSTNKSVGQDPKNADRNRFPESLPYDHSRIILNENINATGSDYINANAIVDSDPKAPAYIATQAPLPNTLGDFWQMVWEQGSVVIVNLTHLSETEILKTPYWPNKGSAIYHIYELHLVSEHVWCDDYLVRSFYLKNLETQETRTVTQFHFLSWTKEGVPSSPKALLEFRRKVNKSFRGKQCPIIVHCNDGVGRTGTYILTDLVLTRMTKGAKEIDIAATLEHIRDHRENLVRTKEHFEFALTAVAEEVNAILKALPQ